MSSLRATSTTRGLDKNAIPSDSSFSRRRLPSHSKDPLPGMSRSSPSLQTNNLTATRRNRLCCQTCSVPEGPRNLTSWTLVVTLVVAFLLSLTLTGFQLSRTLKLEQPQATLVEQRLLLDRLMEEESYFPPTFKTIPTNKRTTNNNTEWTSPRMPSRQENVTHQTRDMDWWEFSQLSWTTDPQQQQRIMEPTVVVPDPPRILYVHVGKSGGTSLESALLTQKVAKHTRAVPCLQQYYADHNETTESGYNKHNHQFIHTNTTAPPFTFSSSSFEHVWAECLYNATVGHGQQKRNAQDMRNHTANSLSSTSVLRAGSRPISHSWDDNPLGRAVVWHKHTTLPRTPRHPAAVAEAFLWSGPSTTPIRINTLLWTVRSPLARLVSAFNYHRHKVWQRRKKEQQHQEEHGANGKQAITAKTTTTKSTIPIDEQFLLECFQNMDHVAEALWRWQLEQQALDQSPSFSQQQQHGFSFPPVSAECTRLARTILTGQGPDGDNQIALQHFYHNYQWYLQTTLWLWKKKRSNPPTIVVLRMSHLWHDVERIQTALRQYEQQRNRIVGPFDPVSTTKSPLTPSAATTTNDTGTLAPDVHRKRNNVTNSSNHGPSWNITSPPSAIPLLGKEITNVHVTHQSEHYQVKSGISTIRGRRAICCLVFDELQAYTSLIVQAVNLNDTEKCHALHELVYQDCPLRIRTITQEMTRIHTNKSAITESFSDSTSNNVLDSVPCQLFRSRTPFPWKLWYNDTCVW